MIQNDNYDLYAQKNYSANIYKVEDSEFILDKRYKPQQYLGNGAYGVVISCEDSTPEIPELKMVAIKKIARVTEHRFYAKRTLRELKILRNLKHENIVNLSTILLPRCRNSQTDIYIVTEVLDTDLKSVLDKEHSKLTQEHFKLFLYQILRAMKYMHSANILHRDLKPTNILLNKNDCMLKICDFGLSRALLQKTKENSSNPNIMTEYVETRYYRAPELLLGLKTYNQAVDMWSVGCIFAEIVTGKTLWRGNSSNDQLKLIFETLGTPTKTQIVQWSDTFVCFRMIEAIQLIGPMAKVPLQKVIPGLCPDAYDLLEKLFQLDYKSRITADQALKHPYLADLHNPEDEPSREPLSGLELQFEMYELTCEQIKDMIYEEILLYHFPEFNQSYFDRIKQNKSVIDHIIHGKNAKIIDPEADDDYPF